MDLNAQCIAQYLTPNNCSLCANSTYDMCNNAAYNINKKCVTSCPTYMYFPLLRTAVNTSIYSVLNSMYNSYTTTAT